MLILLSPERSEGHQIFISIDLKGKLASSGVERQLINYLNFRLRNKYRKVYIASHSRGDSNKDLLVKMIQERLPEEQIDIVSLQHGPDISLFWDISTEETLGLLKGAPVRFIFSSGCQMWGKISFSSDGSIRSTKKNHFADGIKALNPKEVLLFTNDQSYSIYLINQIANLRADTLSLERYFRPFFTKMDVKNSVYLERLNQALQDGNKLKAKIYMNLSVNPVARPVFIQKSHDNYFEKIFMPLPELWRANLELCETLKDHEDLRFRNMAKAICPIDF
jgi:hypothetical protein